MSDDKPQPGCDCPRCKTLAAGGTEEQAVEALMAHFESEVKEHGMIIIQFEFDNGLFGVHTLGFTDLNLPEVVMFGMEPVMAMQVINRYHAELLAGSRMPGPALIDDYFNLPVQVIDATITEEVEMVCWKTDVFYLREGEGKQPKYVQWVFSDKNSKMPWEPGFDAHWLQPVLGEPPVVAAADTRVMH